MTRQKITTIIGEDFHPANIEEDEYSYVKVAGSITVALGGSIGSCFIQAKLFYTSQNVAVLSFDEKVSNKAKLFFANIFMYEVSGKFVAFGQELNKHMKTDFTMYLPVQCDANGPPVTDADNKYIPYWDFMERYIDSLLYSDKIA